MPDDSTVLPIFTKIQHQPNPAATNAFSAEVDKMLAGGKRQLEAFGQDARKTLDAALSVKRNTSGSLDLGVPQLKQAAEAQQARALAAREVANATLAAAKAEGTYSQETRQAIAATKQLALEEEQAAQAARAHANAAEAVQRQLNQTASATTTVITATKTGTTANRQLVNSQAAVKQATIQAGQQLQDLGISIYSGQRASVVFAQQLPQLAFALSGLEGNANKTLDKLGKMGTFLSGPMGLFVGLAVGVLGTYIASLIDAGDESDKLGKKTLSLADALGTSKYATDEGRKAIAAYNDEQAKARDNADAMIKLNLAQAESDIKAALATREKLKALQELANDPATFAGSQYGNAQGAAQGYAQRALDQNNADIARLGESLRNLRIQDATRDAKAAADPIQAINNKYDDMAEAAKRAAAGNYELSRSLESVLTGIEKQRAADLKAQRELNKGTSAAAQASLGDMVALIKQLFPGAVITSTNGGKHTAGSDHYAGRAIDFIPGGGMGKYSTAEVEQILRDAGVDIRRNAKGTEQLFGPGRSADKPGDHNDHFHFAWQGQAPDPTKVAEAVKKAQELLQQFGAGAAESIQRINERFDEQPKLIDQAAQATRKLDDIIAELQERKPPGFEDMIASAEAAKGTIQDALVRPYKELQRDSERRIEIQTLLTSGREDEANALQTIWQLERDLGPLDEAHKAAILDMVKNERLQTEELERRQGIINDYLDATRSIRSELESIFAGEGSFKSFGKIFKELNAKTTVENLFGPALRELDKWTKGQAGAENSVDFLTEQSGRAGNALHDLAGVVEQVSARLANPSSVLSLGGGSPVSPDAPLTFAEAFDKYFLADLKGESLPIVATATKAGAPANDNGLSANALWKMDGQQYFVQLAKALTSPFESAIEKIGGPKFASQVNNVLGGALYGYSVGGLPGGILGALKNATAPKEGETPSWLNDKLGQALGGAQTGAQIAGIAKALGIKKFSTTGSEIGGAIGSFIPIPGGDIIGSIIGGTIGALFKKAKQTYADFGEMAPGQYSLGGGSKYTSEANSLAKSVLDGLDKLTEAFGGTLNQFSLKIGVRNGNYMVDPTGDASFKNGINFGQDAAAAIAFAIQDAIKDGALVLSNSVKNLLTKEGSDLDTQLQKALDFQGVFDSLKELKDPVGAALDKLDKEFTRLRSIFVEAGASTEEYAQLEELYQLERTKAIKEAVEALSSSLQSLYDDLTVNNSALSLRERQAAAQQTYDALKARVAAGDTTAYDDYAQAARTLLEIDREIYGSQKEYFDLLAEVTATTKSTLDQINAQAAASSADPTTGTGSSVPVADNANVVSAVQDGNAIAAAMNQNIITLNRTQVEMIGRLDSIASLLSGTTTAANARVNNY